MGFGRMKLLSETQCCYVGSSVEDTHTMAHTHAATMYHHAGIGLESTGSIMSSSNNIYDAGVPMMGAPPMAGTMTRKMLCQVCGALSSGLHFGVFTCEGCKCFYRRSIKEGANYACAKERNCEITMETRNSCRYCRFQKCLGLGMSKEGIKLGRRPKVDSDTFQHGFYPPNDTDYPPHGYWAAMEQPPPMFKTEPVFSESDEHRERLMYSDVGSGNYAMKPEPYTTCGQFSHGGQYGQDAYGSPHDGQVNGHFGGESNWTKSDRHHLSLYHHPHMHPEMYAIQKCMEQHHSQGAQAQRWTSEPSPTTSGSGSEDNWDGTAVMQNRGIPSSVSLSLPEVQSGAAAAMAYANLYRGKNDEKVTTSKCKDELSQKHKDTCKSSCASYTELVSRKENHQDDTSDFSKCDQSRALYQKTDQSVTLYHEHTSHTLHSPSRAGTGSTSPHHHTSTGALEGSSMWLDTLSTPTKRKSSTPSENHGGGKTRKLTSHSDQKSSDDGSRHACMAEHVQLIQELMDNYVPLEGVVTYQWETYQQGYGEQSYNDQPRYKDSAHLNVFLKTHGEEVLYQIRKFAKVLPGFEELAQSEKDSLLHSTAPSIITTCLLHSESIMSGDRDKRGGIYSTRLDEGACFCAVILLMAGKKNKCLNNELCSKLGIILEAYISEKLSRRDPEKLNWLAEQLHQKMASH